jgi:hypothetical protein
MPGCLRRSGVNYVKLRSERRTKLKCAGEKEAGEYVTCETQESAKTVGKARKETKSWGNNLIKGRWQGRGGTESKGKIIC